MRNDSKSPEKNAKLNGRTTQALRNALHALTLLPTGVVGLVRARRGPTVRHAVVSVLLGLVAWVLGGLIALMIARGALYGFVDSGPYDDAWGGPTRGGAWLAHFVISLPFGAIAGLLLVGITRLHNQESRRLAGERVGRWVTPVIVAIFVLVAFFVFSWTRQI